MEISLEVATWEDEKQIQGWQKLISAQYVLVD